MGETRDQGNGAMELGKKMQMEGERQLRKDNGQGEATGQQYNFCSQ